MKRTAITLLAILYFGVTSGATVQFHYCMGKLVEWGLHGKESGTEKCTKCGMKKGSTLKCCKTSEKQLKIDNSHKAPDASQLSKVFLSDLHFKPFHADQQYLTAEQSLGKLPFSNAPPQISTPPVFILNCNFRI